MLIKSVVKIHLKYRISEHENADNELSAQPS